MVQIALLLMWALCMIGFLASVRVMIQAQRDIRRIVGLRPHRPAHPQFAAEAGQVAKIANTSDASWIKARRAQGRPTEGRSEP